MCVAKIHALADNGSAASLKTNTLYVKLTQGRDSASLVKTLSSLNLDKD